MLRKCPLLYWLQRKYLVSDRLKLRLAEYHCLIVNFGTVTKLVCYLLDIQWDGLPAQVPPKLLPYLPSKSADGEDLGSNYDVSMAEVVVT